MKFLEKKNLLIVKIGNDEYDFDYREDVVFDSKNFDDIEMINNKTKEKFVYRDLVFALSNKGVGYLYPPEMYGTTKVIDDYKVNNWLFSVDRRAAAVADESFKENVTKWMAQVTSVLELLGKSAQEVGAATTTAAQVMNETMGFVSNVQNVMSQPISQPQPSGAQVLIRK